MHRVLPVSCILLTVVGLAGCNNSENSGQSLIPPGPVGANQAPESVSRITAPRDRSDAYVGKVNLYRSQTYGTHDYDVLHSDVLYTAAYRHAVYLNTSNSKAYGGNSASGLEGNEVALDADYSSMMEEATSATTASGSSSTSTVVTDGGIYPALRTHTTIFGRVSAVVGSSTLLKSITSAELFENYVTDGSTVTEVGGPTAFRGYDLSSSGNDPIDSLWYSRIGRLYLMRADLRYIGFASPYDGGIRPPWPILTGQFAGVLTQLGSRPAVNRLGYWPNSYNTNVNPVGLDVTDSLGGTGTRQRFMGPPIHFTLPSLEPILNNGSVTSPSQCVKFKKLEVDPVTGVAQAAPKSTMHLTFKYYTYLGATPSNVGVDPGRNDNPAYCYAIEPVANDDAYPFTQRSTEGFIVPTEPLEPNSWYEVGIRMATPSYVLEDASDLLNNPQRLFTWRFKTNGKVVPAL